MQGRPHIHPLALPALRTFFLFALGILCSHQGWIGGLEAAIAGTLASIICLFSALQPSRRLVTLKPLVRTVALAIGVIALGSARDALFHAHPPHHVFHQIDGRHDDGLCMEGRVTAPPKSSQWSTRITLSTDSLVSGPVTRETCGTILVRADASEWTPDVGDVLRICGQLEHLPQRNNPAEFDYGRYLTRQGISAILQAENLDERTLVHSNPSPLRRLGLALSRYTIQAVSEHVETREGRALAFSLLLGDRTQLDEETLNWFRTTGLSHLLAISGLHVLLVGMVVYALSGPVLFRLGLPFRIAEIIRTVITLSTLGTYLLICGGAASAVRAVVMAATVLIGRIFQFQGHPVNSLGFAGIVLLMVRPDQLEEAGFQLSFAAVGGLLVLLPALSRCVPRFLVPD